jgi:hypothetical protein
VNESPTHKLSVTTLAGDWVLTTEVHLSGEFQERHSTRFATRSELEEELGRRDVGNLDQQRLLDGEPITVWRY